jgi:hypothetical protein
METACGAVESRNRTRCGRHVVLALPVAVKGHGNDQCGRGRPRSRAASTNLASTSPGFSFSSGYGGLPHPNHTLDRLAGGDRCRVRWDPPWLAGWFPYLPFLVAERDAANVVRWVGVGRCGVKWWTPPCARHEPG